MAKVSIIMSAFNTENYIRKSIESVLNQTFNDFEFIIVDNGSKDNTLLIINEYASKDDRIVVLHNETNKLLSEARNQCIDKASGEYLYVIDSDDYIETNLLSDVYKFSKDNNLELVVFGWFMDYIYGDKYLSLPVSPKENIFLNQEDFRKNAFQYLNQSILTVPRNKFYKLSNIKKYNIRYKNTKLEDHHFNMDYIKDVKTVGFLPMPYYHYLRSRDSSELNHIYQFNLFAKKKDHYLHSKEILHYWGLENEENSLILNNFFSERIVQCVQEIIANSTFSKDEKNNKIKEILNDKNAIYAIKHSKPEGLMFKILLFPMKTKNLFLIKTEAKFITWYKNKFKEKYILLKAKKVNKCKV